MRLCRSIVLLFLFGSVYADTLTVARWNFDNIAVVNGSSNTPDTVFPDISGNNHNVYFADLKMVNGVRGKAIELVGTNFQPPVIRNSQKAFNLSKFTMEAWVMLYENPSNMNRLGHYYKVMEYTSIPETGGTPNGFCFDIFPEGKPGVTLGESSDWNHLVSPDPLEINRWYYLTATYDGQLMKFYVDGKLTAQKYSAGYNPVSADATIGVQVRIGDIREAQLYGRIDEMAVKNYAMTDEAVMNEYNSYSPPSPDTIQPSTDTLTVARWNFDNDTILNESGIPDTVFPDISGNNHNVYYADLKTVGGVKGKAIELTGTNFQPPVVRNSQKAFNLSKFTMEAWLMLYENPSDMDRLSHYYKVMEYTSIPETGGTPNGFCFDIFPEGKPGVTLGESGGWNHLVSPDSLEINRWYYLTATYDGQLMKFYVDGKLTAQKYSAGYNTVSADATIGVQVRTDGSREAQLYGRIDEMAVKNYAMSDEAVMNEYRSYPNPELIAYWDFEDDSVVPGPVDSTKVFLDKSGNGHNISSAHISTSSGISGKAIELTGTDFQPIVDNSQKDFVLPQLTVESWVMLYEDPQVTGRYLNQYKIMDYSLIESGVTNGFSLFITDGVRPDFTLGNGGWYHCTSPKSLDLNKWYYIVGTYDGKTMKMYVNGELVAVTAQTIGYLPVNQDARIGYQERLDEGNRVDHFYGRIDEMKIHNIALDAQTILNNYKALAPLSKPEYKINLGMKKTYAEPGDTICMPVYLTNFENAVSISACQFNMSFDTNSVQLLSIDRDSCLIKDWPLFGSGSSAAGITIAAAASTSTRIDYGEGELIRCFFKIKSSVKEGDSCNILLNDVMIDEVSDSITATTVPGKIIFKKPDFIYGDVTGNKVVDIFDAQKVLQYVVGALPLPDSVCCPNFTTAVADVSGNGTVTSYDAALILQHSVGLLAEFPVAVSGKNGLKKRLAAAQPGEAVLSILKTSNSTDDIYIVTGTNLKGFRAGEFSIHYDPEFLNLSNGSISTSIRGATLTSRLDSQKNLLKIAVVTADDIDENNSVEVIKINLPHSSKYSASALLLDSASVNEGFIPLVIENSGSPLKSGTSTVLTTTYKIKITGTQLIIINSGSEEMTLNVWAPNGRMLENKRFPRGNTMKTVELNNTAKGVYLYKIRTPLKTITGSFILNR